MDEHVCARIPHHPLPSQLETKNHTLRLAPRPAVVRGYSKRILGFPKWMRTIYMAGTGQG